MGDIVSLLKILIEAYMYVVVFSVVLSWLIQFNIVNTQNRTIYAIVGIAQRLTEPLLQPIRRILPPLGGIDLSPLILIFLLFVLHGLLSNQGLGAVLWVIREITSLYIMVVIVRVVVGRLIIHGMVNPRNPVVQFVIGVCDPIIEPALRRLRRILPRVAGFDPSPLVLIILVWLGRELVIRLFAELFR